MSSAVGPFRQAPDPHHDGHSQSPNSTVFVSLRPALLIINLPTIHNDGNFLAMLGGQNVGQQRCFPSTKISCNQLDEAHGHIRASLTGDDCYRDLDVDLVWDSATSCVDKLRRGIIVHVHAGRSTSMPK